MVTPGALVLLFSRISFLTLFPNIIFQYLDEPLAYLTVTYTRVSDFISPNVMSMIGVGVAAVSAKFLSHKELKYRQLGVLVFAVRDYIDALDGSTASGQVGEKTHTIQIVKYR